jgi:hypothetical protein
MTTFLAASMRSRACSLRTPTGAASRFQYTILRKLLALEHIILARDVESLHDLHTVDIDK